MSVTLPVSVFLVLVGLFFLLLLVPGVTELISDFVGRPIRSIWRKSTKFSFALIGALLFGIGVYYIIHETTLTSSGQSLTGTPIAGNTPTSSDNSEAILILAKAQNWSTVSQDSFDNNDAGWHVG